MIKRIELKCYFLLLIVFAPFALCAQNIEKPNVKGKTSFAIVTDSKTLQECSKEIAEYKQTIESEGLPSFVISSDWQTPEQVKQILIKLSKENNLEGAVFIGDVPIAMLMKAQFLTSAYKMDERKNPLEVVAVPSDRFYDDFDLKFNKIADSTKGLMHFYELAPDSNPYIECDIYTGRIVAQKSNGCPYNQIRKYLEKAVAAHKDKNQFNQFISYTGHGSYSNSITAWRAEQQIVNEQFGDLFKTPRIDDASARYIRYSMQDYMKPFVIKELRRPDADFMVFHEHGDFHRMYLSGYPEERNPKEYLSVTMRSFARRDRDIEKTRQRAEKYGLDSAWYVNYNSPELVAADSLYDLQTGIILEEVNDIAPNARMVVFDACYNADFRNPDFIAGKFIMAPGKCIVGFGNSVNVLQDKSAFDLLGLLKDGVRVGLWAQHINILESHIIGDPTFHFEPYPNSENLNEIFSIKDNSYWFGRLDDPNPEIQNVALIKLFVGNYKDISEILLNKVKHSSYAIVRYNSLYLLEKLNDKNYWEALKLSTKDSFEYIRRIAVTRMGSIGAEEFLPYLIDTYINDIHSARIIFNAGSSLLCFDTDKAVKAIEDYFANKNYFNASKDKDRLLKLVKDNPGKESVTSIVDSGKSSRHRVSYIQFLRNRQYHQNLEEVLKVMENPAEDELIRTMIAEAVAWWRLSYKRDKILESCRKLLTETQTPQQMRPALESAITRLTSNK